MSNIDRRRGTDTKPQSMLGRPGLLQIGRGTTGRDTRIPNSPKTVTAIGVNERDAAQAAANLATIKASAAENNAARSATKAPSISPSTVAQNATAKNPNVNVAIAPTPGTPAPPAKAMGGIMAHKGNKPSNIWARPTSENPRARMGVNSDDTMLSPEINTALGNVGNAVAQTGRAIGGVAKGVVNSIASGFILADENRATGNGSFLSPKTMTALGFSSEAVAQANAKEAAFDKLNIAGPGDVAATATKAVDQWSATWIPVPSTRVAETVAVASNALGEATPGIAVGVLSGGATTAREVIGGTVASRLVGSSNAFTKEYVASGGDYGSALTTGAVEYATELAGSKILDPAFKGVTAKFPSWVNTNIIDAATNAIGEGAEEVISGFGLGHLSGDGYTLSQAADDFILGGAVGAAAAKIRAPIEFTISAVKDAGNTLIAPIKNAVDSVKSTSSKALNSITDPIQKGIDSIKTATNTALTNLLDTPIAFGGGVSSNFIKGGSLGGGERASLSAVGEPSINLGNLTEVPQPYAKELIQGGATVSHESMADISLVHDLPSISKPNFGSDSTLNVGNLTPASAKETEVIAPTRPSLSGISGGLNLSQNLGNLTEVVQSVKPQIMQGGTTVSLESQADLSLVDNPPSAPKPNFGADNPLNDVLGKVTPRQVEQNETYVVSDVPSLGVVDGAKYIAAKNSEADMYRQIERSPSLEVLRGGSNVSLTSDADLSVVDDDGSATSRSVRIQDDNMRPVNPRPYIVPDASNYTGDDSTPAPTLAPPANNPYATQDSMGTESVVPRSESVGGVFVDGSAVPSTPETEPWKFPDYEPTTPEVAPNTPEEMPEAPARILEPFNPEIWPGVEPGEQPDIVPDDLPQIQPSQPDAEPEPVQEPEQEPDRPLPTREPGKILPFPGTQDPAPSAPEPDVQPDITTEPSIEPDVEPPEILPDTEPDAPAVDPGTETEEAPEETPSEEVESTPDPKATPDTPLASPNPDGTKTVSPSTQTETSSSEVSPVGDPSTGPVTMPYERPVIEAAPSPDAAPSPATEAAPSVAPDIAPSPAQAVETAIEADLNQEPVIEPSTVVEAQPSLAPEEEVAPAPEAAPAVEPALNVDLAKRKDPMPLPQSGLFAGIGSKGRIYDTQGYDRTFGGLSSS